ncbi:MAG: type I-D CRISPR-associated helicase Cas3' [Candidatus Lokiarchaeota archaeon]|nr:type I-D CRISPR-associated helicase Cas3' [Candidatus Lokiarchaeota archaeon]
MNSIEIKPSYIERTDFSIGTLRLHEFQKKFLESRKKYIFLQTPTGSGKTLAGLTKILHDESRFSYESIRSLIVYPTNSLILDQLSSLQDLIRKIGWKSLVIDSESVKNSMPVNTNLEASVDEYVNKAILKTVRAGKDDLLFLIPINSRTLSDFADLDNGKRKYSKGRILLSLITNVINLNVNFIVLSNIDFIFLLFCHKYYSSRRLFPEAFNLNSLIVDEFHLYGGALLGYLIQIVRIFHKQMFGGNIDSSFWMGFLSATPSEMASVFRESFPDPRWVENIQTDIFSDLKKDRELFQIRHPTQLNFVEHNNILFDEDDLKKTLELIWNVINSREYEAGRAHFPVKLLIIVNSVMFSEKLYLGLKKFLDSKNKGENVYRIHGLLPKSERFDIRANGNQSKNAILIGTRAIEIGIDFNVPFLIFEGNEYNSFFQRLGRGGRFQSCIAYSMVSTETVSKIERTKGCQSLQELGAALKNVVPADDLLIDFLFSEQFLKFSVPFFGSLIFHDYYDYYKRDFVVSGKVLREKIKGIIGSLPEIKYHGKLMKGSRDIDDAFKFFSTNPLKQAISFLSCRGTLITFLAYYENYKTWDLIEMSELQSYSFSLKSIQDLDQDLFNEIPARWISYLESEVVIIVHEILEKPEKWSFSTKDSKNETFYFKQLGPHIPLKLVESEILANSTKSKKFIEDLLKNRNYYLPYRLSNFSKRLDWKIKYFIYRGKNGFKWKLYLGNSSYIADFYLQ